MNTAYIGLGTNIGDREAFLKEALVELRAIDGISVEAVSSIYETDPIGYLDQGKFLNMVARVNTTLPPSSLLDSCMQVEQNLGRKREIRWGPRTIDIDILLYNQENIVTENLVIPHPRMLERAFVVIPLLELDHDITLPDTEKPLRELVKDIPGKEGVQIWKQINGEEEYGHSEN